MMDELDSYLASIISLKGFKRGIYLGCAMGGRIGLLRNLLKVDGLDISAVYIKRAKQRYPMTRFIVADIRKYKSKVKYDVAITHGLLIHIHPDDIKKTIKNILKLAKHAIFVESSGKEVEGKSKYEPKKYWDNRARHTGDKDGRNDLPMQYYYSHDYQSIFQSLGIQYQVVYTFDEVNKTKMYYLWQ